MSIPECSTISENEILGYAGFGKLTGTVGQALDFYTQLLSDVKSPKDKQALADIFNIKKALTDIIKNPKYSKSTLLNIRCDEEENNKRTPLLNEISTILTQLPNNEDLTVF